MSEHLLILKPHAVSNGLDSKIILELNLFQNVASITKLSMDQTFIQILANSSFIVHQDRFVELDKKIGTNFIDVIYPNMSKRELFYPYMSVFLSGISRIIRVSQQIYSWGEFNNALIAFRGTARVLHGVSGEVLCEGSGIRRKYLAEVKTSLVPIEKVAEQERVQRIKSIMENILHIPDTEREVMDILHYL